MRAVDSGIYASLNSTQMPNLTAGNFQTKIKTKDKDLKTNLNNVMASVRGHSTYWSQICSD
jgi:hypothetical protein